MHALVLAAGEGRRLAAPRCRPPKPFVAVGGRTLLGGLLEAFADVRCDSVTCCVRAEHAEAARAIASWAAADRPARVVACLTPSSLHTLVIGLGAAPKGPVIAAMVDAVMRRADFRAAAARIQFDLAKGADAVLAVTPAYHDERPVYVATNADRRVIRVSGDPIDPVRVAGGLYGLGPRARAFARSACDRGLSCVRSLLASLVEEGLVVRAVEVPRIVDVDRPADVEAADAWLRAAGEATR